MSRFLAKRVAGLAPYTPGEQPRDKRYTKLNTNECPYPPSPLVIHAIHEASGVDLRLYPDPESLELRRTIAAAHSLTPRQIFAGGGSDEILAYFFMAFFDKGDKVYYPDISYGFYSVYAELFGLQAVELPLREDFTVDIESYFGADGHIVIANPNAPTGIALTPEEIEQILAHNPNRLVLIDEAYVDFSKRKSCLPLLGKYDNLLLVRTASKSRALAGMRLGWAFGSAELIAALDRVRFSFDPYNLSRLTMAAGIAAMQDKRYFENTCGRIIKTRESTVRTLTELGFTVLPSEANFVFAKHASMGGQELYLALKERGVLVRHFEKARIRDFNRITIGTDEEMNLLLTTIKELL